MVRVLVILMCLAALFDCATAAPTPLPTTGMGICITGPGYVVSVETEKGEYTVHRTVCGAPEDIEELEKIAVVIPKEAGDD